MYSVSMWQEGPIKRAAYNRKDHHMTQCRIDDIKSPRAALKRAEHCRLMHR